MGSSIYPRPCEACGISVVNLYRHKQTKIHQENEKRLNEKLNRRIM